MSEPVNLTEAQRRLLKAMCGGLYGDFGDGLVITPRNGITFKPAECERVSEADVARLVELGLILDRRDTLSCARRFWVNERGREALAASQETER